MPFLHRFREAKYSPNESPCPFVQAGLCWTSLSLRCACFVSAFISWSSVTARQEILYSPGTREKTASPRKEKRKEPHQLRIFKNTPYAINPNPPKNSNGDRYVVTSGETVKFTFIALYPPTKK